MRETKRDLDISKMIRSNSGRSFAVVGFLNTHNCILLIRTRRFPDHWQPIGGGIDPADETPIDTVIREVKEETHLKLLPEELAFEITTNQDFGAGRIYFYTARLGKEEPIRYNPLEIVEGRWFNLDDALSLPMFSATRQFLLHLHGRQQGRQNLTVFDK